MRSRFIVFSGALAHRKRPRRSVIEDRCSICRIKLRITNKYKVLPAQGSRRSQRPVKLPGGLNLQLLYLFSFSWVYLENIYTYKHKNIYTYKHKNINTYKHITTTQIFTIATCPFSTKIRSISGQWIFSVKIYGPTSTLINHYLLSWFNPHPNTSSYLNLTLCNHNPNPYQMPYAYFINQ